MTYATTKGNAIIIKSSPGSSRAWAVALVLFLAQIRVQAAVARREPEPEPDPGQRTGSRGGGVTGTGKTMRNSSNKYAQSEPNSILMNLTESRSQLQFVVATFPWGVWQEWGR
ncbi:hypothetical protein ACLKA6_003541 [Drosophila palustris]